MHSIINIEKICKTDYYSKIQRQIILNIICCLYIDRTMFIVGTVGRH